MNKLSPPSTKTPLMEGSKETLNHIWQRWFSDLYENVKSSSGAGSGSESLPGPQGPTGPQGPAGSQGPQGSQGAAGLNVNVLADGGFANSVYLASQSLDGGGA